MGQLVPPTVGITILEEQRLGYFGLSLTEFTTLGVPQIIGNIEVAGALYTFSTPETILGLSSTPAGDVWVKLLPQIGGTITAAWTEIAPAWSDEKQGWYSPTAGQENQRYVFRATKIDNSNVKDKTRLEWQTTLRGDNWRGVLSTLLGDGWSAPFQAPFSSLTAPNAALLSGRALIASGQSFAGRVPYCDSHGVSLADSRISLTFREDARPTPGPAYQGRFAVEISSVSPFYPVRLSFCALLYSGWTWKQVIAL